MENEVIINRMIRELEQAKGKQANPEAMRKHIGNVQLLGSLFFGENKVETDTPPSFSEKEKGVMFGDLVDKNLTTKQNRFADDDANGKSIFDF